MKSSIRAFWILLLIPALAACPHARPGPGAVDASLKADCRARGNPVDCAVDVIVDQSEDGLNCTVRLENAIQTELEFENVSSNRERFIYWKLTSSPDYSFTRNGVIFQNDWNADFDQYLRNRNGQTFRVRNKNPESIEVTTEYKYAISVVRSDNPLVACQLDPYIRNLR